VLQVAVADRTALILDIFSQRARTREGKLQVRLTLLTRLIITLFSSCDSQYLKAAATVPDPNATLPRLVALCWLCAAAAAAGGSLNRHPTCVSCCCHQTCMVLFAFLFVMLSN
jgi:hypothetical protein